MSEARVSITPSDAWSDDRLTALQCRLLGLIGSYLGKDHRAWPSQSTLAERLKCSRKAVSDGVKALKKYGYIEVENRTREDGGQSSNCYFVLMDPCNRRVTPLSPEGGTPCNPIEVTPPVTSEGYTHKKDPIERPKEDNGFEQAWKTYNSTDLKVNQTKKLAKEQWAKAIKKADPETILKAIEREVADRTNPKGWIQNLSDMHRWLRNEKWDDVLRKEEALTCEELSEEQYALAMRNWVETRVWDVPSFSPAPDQPGCKVPAGMLRHAVKELSSEPQVVAAVLQNIPLEAA